MARRARKREEELQAHIGSELQAWFMADPQERELQLKAVGFSMDSIRKIRYNRGTDKFLVQHRIKLETLTGLNVESMLVRGTKRFLWGEEDKLPHIVTRAQAADALRNIAPGNYHLLDPHLHFGGGPKRFDEYVAHPSTWWATRLVNVFTVLARPPQAKPPKVDRAPSAPLPAKAEPPRGGSERGSKVLDSCIALINSTARIVENGIEDPRLLPDSAKLSLCYAVNTLLGKLGIDAQRLKELRRQQMTPDAPTTDNVATVLGLFGSKR